MISWQHRYQALVHKPQKIVSAILTLLSVPYQAAVRLRNGAYDRGWLRSHRPPNKLIISVGNLVVGGTGKTPFTARLADHLGPDRVAILSRGYGSKAARRSPRLVLPQDLAMDVGDEPLLHRRHHPEVEVWVGKERLQSACQTARPCLILDDGFQHRRLCRDEDIVLLDAADPFGQEALLPRGFLREPLTALKRATLVVVNRLESHEQFQEIKEKLSRYTNAPLIGMAYEPVGVHFGEEVLTSLQGKQVALFCGIAKPQQLVKTVERLGACVVHSWWLADHKSLTVKDLNTFAKRGAEMGADMVVCSEKDWVKLPAIKGLPLPLGWVEAQIRVVENDADWQKFIKHLQGRLPL